MGGGGGGRGGVMGLMYGVKWSPVTEVGKTRDGRTSVTFKMGIRKTRDGTVRDIYATYS